MARRRLPLALGGAGVMLCLVLGLTVGGDRDQADTYTWERVSRGDIRETISASGEVQAKVRVKVGTSVMGEIKELHVRDGQSVQAGDLLVTLDQERLKQDLRRAEAVSEAARAELRRAEAVAAKQEETSRRMEALHAQNLISQEEHRQSVLSRESARLAVEAARAQWAQAQASVEATRDALSKSVLKAPITGRITGLRAEKGETAIPGTSNLPGAVLMVISDMSQLLAEVRVNENEVVHLRPGQTAQVTVEPFPGKVFRGRVAEVATGAERGAGEANLYLVKVALELSPQEAEAMRPGMSVRALILTGEAKQILKVPIQAVLERDPATKDAASGDLLASAPRTVVMVARGGKAREQAVTVGLADTKSYEVKEGLKEGEQVLTGPLRKLKDLKDQERLRLRAKPDAEAAAPEKPKG